MARKIGPLHIHSITRARSSSNGNPAFVLHTSEGDYRTQADASLGYGLENFTHVIGDDVPAVTLVATAAGRVWGIEKDGELMH